MSYHVVVVVIVVVVVFVAVAVPVCCFKINAIQTLNYKILFVNTNNVFDKDDVLAHDETAGGEEVDVDDEDEDDGNNTYFML